MADHCNWKNLTVCTNSQVRVTKLTFTLMLKKLFHETVLSNLVNVGFEPVLLLQLKPNRSVIVHSVDRGILHHEVGKIKR